MGYYFVSDIMKKIAETDLYLPIKSYLEALGYKVKSEVGHADIVALRNGASPLIVELKTTFSLALLHQALARQTLSDTVFVAVPRWSGKSGWKAFRANIGLCKKLGLGVMSVSLSDGVVTLHYDPKPIAPRKNSRRKEKLLTEFHARDGDPNLGGTRGQIMTSYRQDAFRCLQYLAQVESASGAVICHATGIKRATKLMADNHYGWFERISRGIYVLTNAGKVVAHSAE
ncbi:MAG: DUF2161 family putative PD-(D/E)XK-type phosphodiesterase, partial [Paracoccaceae bacterium]